MDRSAPKRRPCVGRLDSGSQHQRRDREDGDDAGCHNGTIAGVYGDIGIFYSTDPRTAYNTWARTVGRRNPATNDNTITNNSGDVVLAPEPVGRGTTCRSYSGSNTPGRSPIVDGPISAAMRRGVSRTPWLVRKAAMRGSSIAISTATIRRDAAASSYVGPWNRIKYPGSQVSYDQPGLNSTVLGFAATDGSQVGFTLSPSTPLTATVAQTDTTSPNAIRWASAR